MSFDVFFTKDNLDMYLKELAKEHPGELNTDNLQEVLKRAREKR